MQYENTIMTETTEMTVWADELAKYAAESAKSEAPHTSTISLRSGVLSYQGQPVVNNKLEVVILDSVVERTFYEDRFDPNNISSPVCFAFASNGQCAPHEAAAKPQHATCSGCPRDAWGSSLSGGRGKACQERRKLALIPATAAATADGVLSAEVATLRLPVTSVKAWGGYVQSLAALHRRPPFAVVTEIGVKPDARSQFVVTFRTADLLDDSIIQAILQKRELVQPLLTTPYTAPTPEPTPTPAPAAPTKGRKFE
jgi:hypothetical protein